MATKISSGSKFSAIRSFSKLLRPLSARAAASKMAEAVSVFKLGRINRKRKKAERVRELLLATKKAPAKKKIAVKKTVVTKKSTAKKK